MSEHVEPVDLGVEWEPNAPDAVLVSDDGGDVVLALNSHPNDNDDRCVTLIWSGARIACMGDPNDEAISAHRLYRAGLADLRWAGIVRESALIHSLETQNRVHPHHNPERFEGLTHYVLPLKECVVEVVGADLTVRRFSGSTRQAALDGLGG